MRFLEPLVPLVLMLIGLPLVGIILSGNVALCRPGGGGQRRCDYTDTLIGVWV
jgi:hypothetical protein